MEHGNPQRVIGHKIALAWTRPPRSTAANRASRPRPLKRGFAFLVVALTRLGSASTYLRGTMLSPAAPSGFIEPCLPSSAECPPSDPNWIYEIKHDGYRLMARRDLIGIGIRLLTRNGNDWSSRYPQIVEALRCARA